MVSRSLVAPSSLVFVAASLGVALAGTPREDRERQKLVSPAYNFSAGMIEGLGATPGGAQDIGFFRDRVTAGEVPHPNVFTPEGLFSEHDLPLRHEGACKQLLCMTGEATSAMMIVQPEVQWLAQVGFDSGLSPKTWKRAPLDLIAVIDKSGSMSGQPLALVKESLLQVASQLGPDDRLGVVLYGDRSYVHLPMTAGSDKAALVQGVAAIESAGSTNMEEGLKVAYDLAKRSLATRQKGATTRVMLFTDERPNVGATDAASFLGMAEQASKDGIGLTTVGVGVQFGAELATKISAVRGGNLFFFPDVLTMKTKFQDELDTLVTELAYDLDMVVSPAPGVRIAGVYGVPGQMLAWSPDHRTISLHISTIFLSKKSGAIYVALGSDTADALPQTTLPVGGELASVRVDYTPRGKAAETSEVALRLAAPEQASIGLLRGRLLVDEVTTLKQATALHHEKNDQEGAYQLVHAIASILRQTSDPELASERQLTTQLEATLAKLSGHAGEPPTATNAPPVDPVSGLPTLR